MFRILIAAHAPVASATLKAMNDILGEGIPLYALDTSLERSPEERHTVFEQMVDELLADGELLVLVDFLGGTPSNIALPQMDRAGVEIITGYNMPIVLKAVSLARQGVGIAEAVENICAYGCQHIKQVSSIL